MFKIKKVPLFALVLALMLSAGGSCIFPMLSAQAASSEPTMNMSDHSAHDASTESADEQSTEAMGHLPAPMNHVSTCTSDCGQASQNTITIKKSQGLSDLPLLASQGRYFLPSPIDSSSLGALDPPELPPLRDALLAVAKKE